MIAQPIEVFAAFAKILAVGDVDVGKVTTDKDRMLAKRKDEIGTLASSFDSVIESTTLMAQQTSRIADGDLTVAVTVRSQEDVLGRSLQQLVEKCMTWWRRSPLRQARWMRVQSRWQIPVWHCRRALPNKQAQ